jgi:hypothetical protein
MPPPPPPPSPPSSDVPPVAAPTPSFASSARGPRGCQIPAISAFAACVFWLVMPFVVLVRDWRIVRRVGIDRGLSAAFAPACRTPPAARRDIAVQPVCHPAVFLICHVAGAIGQSRQRVAVQPLPADAPRRSVDALKRLIDGVLIAGPGMKGIHSPGVARAPFTPSASSPSEVAAPYLIAAAGRRPWPHPAHR